MCDRLGGFLAGFVVGGLVGGAVALLLAPAPGEETRQRIAEQAEKATQEARRLGGEYQERKSEIVAEKRELIQQAIEEGRQAAVRTAAELREGLEKRRAGEEPAAEESSGA